MGLMEPQIKSAEALKTLANEATRPYYKKSEFWIGAVANIIAIAALVIAICALNK